MGGGKFSQQLSGEFTGLMIWKRVLENNEVKKQFECKKVNADGLGIDWRKVELQRGESVMLIEREIECPVEANEEIILGFGQRVKWGEAETACKSLGGKQDLPSSREEMYQIKDKFKSFLEECNNKFWLPISQIDGR